MAQHTKLKLSSFLIASSISFISHASGFAIIEQSVTGLGAAFSGSAAIAEDASTIFFNPAGLTNLEHAEINIAAHYIAPQSDFNDAGSRSPFGAALTGDNGGDGAKNAIVPNFYYSHPINKRTVFGLGIGAPFGLVTEYDDAWKGRYHAVKSDLKIININPSLAFKASDKLSLGFGINVQKINLELTQMADLAASSDPALSQTSDGKVQVEAHDWSWGYNLGVTFQATEATRLGLAYRSKISHTLKGDGSIASNASGSQVARGAAKGKVSLPESLSLAFHHHVNEQWAVMADASWTRWSRFKELTIRGQGTFPSSTKPENWSNTMRYGLGVSYLHNDKWTFRSGVAYDETPISDQFRTPRIPGEDRTWLAVGASYNYSKNIVLDAGYTHLFVNDPNISDIDDKGYSLVGDYEASVDILSIQMRWLFL